MSVYCHMNLDQIRESGLIEPARLAAIERDLDSRISIPLTAAGLKIESARVADFGGGRLMLYPRMDHDLDGTYMRRQLLEVVLTQEELKLVNDDCLSASEAKRQAAQFAKAARVSWSGYQGGAFWGDTYYHSMDEALDMIVSDHERGDDWPTHVWAATARTVIPELDVSDVTEHYVADRGWEDCSIDDLEGVTELQAALDRFVDQNVNVLSYSPDYSTAIMLDGVNWEVES